MHVTKVVKRTFYPNLQTKRIWVPELKRWVVVKLTAKGSRPSTRTVHCQSQESWSRFGLRATLQKVGVN